MSIQKDAYVAVMNGVLAARAYGGGLGQETEAELAEVSDTIWRQLSEDEQNEIEGLVEQAKARWTRIGR